MHSILAVINVPQIRFSLIVSRSPPFHSLSVTFAAEVADKQDTANIQGPKLGQHKLIAFVYGTQAPGYIALKAEELYHRHAPECVWVA